MITFRYGMLKKHVFSFCYLLFFVQLITAGTFLEASQQLANYLGTGSNPRIQLQLSANGPNWGAYTIDYQGIGNVPWSSDASNNWSSWNVVDTATPPNYYGTITLTSDGSSVQWNNYVGGPNGYYLDGIHLSYNSGISAYQLTVDAIYPNGGGGGGTGPFPDAPPAVPAVYSGTSDPIILQVSGNKIVDNHGNEILLKGIVRPSLEWSATGQYLSTQDLSNIANWQSGGATAKSNVIRLDLYQGYWLNSAPATQIGSYKQIINAIVYYATQLGMAVILDLHWVESGYQTPMADSDSITFWQQVATDYASFGTVMFELYNEPYGITTDVWLNGDSTYAGYQQLYNAVRGTGAQNICIVGGLDYAYDLSFVSPSFKVNGTNIVYCSHPYDAKGQPGYQGEGGTFEQNYQGILGNFPLIFTEFGTNESSYYPNGYQQIYSNTLNFINTNGVHYTGFAWWVQEGDPQFPCLIEDWNGDALDGGTLIHNDLIQNPGTLIGSESNVFLSFETLIGSQTKIHFNALKFGSGLFFWEFGDASGIHSTPALTSHTYPRAGSYVVTLKMMVDGQPQFVSSKTIRVPYSATSCQPVCPPRDVKARRVCSNHLTTVYEIEWKKPKEEAHTSPPLYYLVFRDKDLTDLAAKVSATESSHERYKVKDHVKKSQKVAYTVVSVDENGNRSIPITTKSRFKFKPNLRP